MFALAILPSRCLSLLILERFTVRIHSRIAEIGRGWARLWYLFRAFDHEGSGFIRIPLIEITRLLAAGASTTYQWLREGASAGAFRWWKCHRGELRVALGGLFKICQRLGLKKDRKGIPPWGVAAEIPLHQILTLGSLRAAATAGMTQRLQQLSRHAAWASLPNAARKTYRLPQPDEYFNVEERGLSHDSGNGSIPCVLHVGPHRIFVSKGHIPYGTSQRAIAVERNVCDRTVHRHLKLMGVESKQLVQTKAAYGPIAQALSWDAPSFAPEPNISLRWNWSSGPIREGEYTLTEPSGRVGKPYSFPVKSGRFFEYGGRYWIYRCNLYRPELKLCRMTAAQSSYHATKPTTNVSSGVCSTGGGEV